MNVDVIVHWTFHRRYHIINDQPTTCYHDYYHLYIVTIYDLARDSFQWKWYFHVYMLKLLLSMYVSLQKEQFIAFFFNFLKDMLFCSTSGKMASFLIRLYSEHDVHITAISNVQSASCHDVQQTSIIRQVKRFTSKRTLRFKVQITFAFVRLLNVQEE